MVQEAELALRVQSPRSQHLRSNYTDAIVLTPHSPTAHTPQKPDAQMSMSYPATPTPIRRPSSTLPSSVPKGPRAMMLCHTSMPTQRTSPVRVSQLPSADFPQKPLPDLIIPKSPKTIVEEPKVPTTDDAALVIRRPEVKETEVRCWACGMKGHDMMECKHLCGHCGQGGHSSIACQYRTLPGGKDGNVVLDGTLGEELAATTKEAEKSGNLNPELVNLISKAKAAKKGTLNGKLAKKQDVGKGPSTMRQTKIARGETRRANHETRKVWKSPSSEERMRRMRERSYSTDSYSKRGAEYRCETDRSPGQYRERGYRAKKYRLGADRNEHKADFVESPRIAYKRRGYIPEENGKWRRDRSPEREGIEDRG